MLTVPGPTRQTLRELGVGVVRVTLAWNTVAPARRPSGFNPVLSRVLSGRELEHLRPDRSRCPRGPDHGRFLAERPGALWAAGRGQPSPGNYGEWKPSASAFGQFVEAVATRYSGSYDPTTDTIVHGDANDLPRVSFWELWNEPNFGMDLAPQAIKGSTVPASAPAYRSLLDAGWRALGLTGHGFDTIVIGNLDARGQTAKPHRGAPQGLPGNFGATKPLQFIRTLYCVSSSYKELRGAAAAAVGCPTSAAGSRRFRAAHPALFRATGFAAHPYPVNLPPTEASSTDPDYTEFAELPRLATALDRLERIYGSGKRFPIYNNEYGYITNPPNNSSSHFVSPATAAEYINWAEYLSWRNRRIASTMRGLLYDPNPTKDVPEFGGFASGLIFYGGARKPGYNAYRPPLFLRRLRSRTGARSRSGGASGRRISRASTPAAACSRCRSSSSRGRAARSPRCVR